MGQRNCWGNRQSTISGPRSQYQSDGEARENLTMQAVLDSTGGTREAAVIVSRLIRVRQVRPITNHLPKPSLIWPPLEPQHQVENDT